MQAICMCSQQQQQQQDVVVFIEQKQSSKELVIYVPRVTRSLCFITSLTQFSLLMSCIFFSYTHLLVLITGCFFLYLFFLAPFPSERKKETQAQLSKAHTHKACSPADFTFSSFFCCYFSVFFF